MALILTGGMISGVGVLLLGLILAPPVTQPAAALAELDTRRNEGVSIWVVRSADITASSPDEKDPMFAPSGDKVYRHPTFYDIPDDVPHI